MSLASLGSILSTLSNSLHPLSTTPALRDQGGDDGFSVGTDPFALVATDVVDVYLVEAQVEETLDVLAVLIQVGRDKDAAFEKELCPWCGTQGWKWSAAIAPPNPACSASWHQRRRSVG